MNVSGLTGAPITMEMAELTPQGDGQAAAVPTPAAAVLELEHAASAALGVDPTMISSLASGDHDLPQVVAAATERSGAMLTAAAAMAVDADQLFDDLPARDQAEAKLISEALLNATFKVRGVVEPSGNPEIDALTKEIANNIAEIDRQRNRTGLVPMDETERQAHAMGAVVRWVRNEGSGVVSRLGSNALSVGVRAGLMTAVATFGRNLAGWSMQRVANLASTVAAEAGAAVNATAGNGTTVAGEALQDLGAWSPTAAQGLVHSVGGAAVGIMLGLQIFGAIRDYRTGAATTTSQALRLAHTATASYMIGATAAQGNWASLAPWLGVVASYSVLRGLGTAVVGGYDSNVKQYPARALAAATAAYAGAQGAGNLVQEGAGWWAGPSADGIRTTDRYTGDTRSAQQIAQASHPWGENVGHSLLNAGLEIFDDLQFNAISRAFQTRDAKRELAAASHEVLAQYHAAALRGMVQYSQLDPDATAAALETAGAEAIRNHKDKAVEGLRMSFQRRPPSEAMVEERISRGLDVLERLGYKFDHNAPRDGYSLETNHNRMITAFLGQELEQLHRDQPLEITRTFTRTGLRGLGNRVVNQFANVEAHRQSAFNAIFGAFYQVPLAATPTQVPNAQVRVHGANAGYDSVVLVGAVAGVYPQLYAGLLNRQGTNEERAAAAQVQSRVESPDFAPSQSGAADV
ncbi:hypothetical protein [Burkholderia diffusa]|uniref:hypothetical protein n=1 Tax=Burkholderia diffusa TaxID=488732 RepID=UPI00076C0C1D|nr:hypothetical protein [Burkholderia diffusa]KVN02934.1 hypothetical protein WJ62_12045 [Burkholderia diffusa]